MGCECDSREGNVTKALTCRGQNGVLGCRYFPKTHIEKRKDI